MFCHTSRQSNTVSEAESWQPAVQVKPGLFFIVILGLRPENPSHNRHFACFFMDCRIEVRQWHCYYYITRKHQCQAIVKEGVKILGREIGKAEEILANQKRLNYKLSDCNLPKHISPSDTVWGTLCDNPKWSTTPLKLEGLGELICPLTSTS